MSKLEQLINELCPDGVEYKYLDKIFNIKNGYTPSKKKKEYWENGNIPWFRMEDIREHGRILNDSIQHVTPCAIKGELFPKNSIIVSTTATIGEHALILSPYLTNQQLTNFNIKKEYKHLLNIKFVYYYFFELKEEMENLANRGGGISIISLTKLKKLKIPLPPLPVQEEIVRILDTFTELAAELTAELTARKKQYEYYRDELLKFGDEVERVKLGDIAKIERGGSLQKKDFIEQGFPCIHYGQIYTKYSKFPNKTFTYISKEKAFKQKKANKNDIIMAVTSENIEDVCKCIAWCGENEVAVGGHTAIISHNQNHKYLTYYFNTQMFFKQKIKLAHGTKVIEVSPKKLNNIIIPLPPLSEQQRIVDILDRFDTLCNDITNGLPAEIEKRQKQYEYYRDKLLDFKELSK